MTGTLIKEIIMSKGGSTLVLKLKQYICRHKFRLIAKHKYCQENLWVCDKCSVFLTQHYGVNVHYLSKEIPNIEWVFIK